MGCAFPLEPSAEIASQNPRLEWDTRLSVPASHHIRDAGFCALCIRQAAAFGGSPGLRIACDVDATDQRVGALVNRITKDRFIEIGELTGMAHTIVVA